ncbi:MAG: 3-methylcrotonyl-CoA carboxylase [Bdellovibrio sp. CG12_big_fil_rev_8_21_14_0_65_39_13]|nr:MAG: 3-methylcrotonyl-CoA carboxylase [Bdellovibrio sp. CG22_combo_CG10-13_8_21_14_all_39_27]PIQ59576.1 MAG: 3-methylcrotonyl-CoA carboxylase [Bdellovibrio sp. CG12_big_fil_rev_8_21_14_0_65_39_13]PIR33188.1 MAG: 3-methylcrotonyl-CoA carboxylase [Bdellovibrio sp. CG11_big_fil_rev_8_21_14_0_20_39_38]
MKSIKRILIANRGEIAMRIMRTCREMEIETVTVYTDEEQRFPHVFTSNRSVNLGSGPLSETYLNMDKLIEIAKEHECQAIHPGYGFLSERATFAKKVEAAELIFIGPSARAIESMGDKKGSKEIAIKVGVPVIPGYHGDDQSAQILLAEAKKMKWPILIKASAGGGGKGMRVVEKEADFNEALESAKREAMSSFGDDRMLIEKYIEHPRHIEVQVFSDSKGNHVHLFERECSIQRRHQKIIEESPSMALTATLRKQICESAVKLSRHINYLGAGTVEFILDRDGSFYFLEMNTRLQVEHPVTEMVTGTDLVEWQIRVARGEELPLKQDQIKQKGHAIEARICSEDPDNNFMPSLGHLHFIGTPSTSYTRFECGMVNGNDVLLNFDPMLAKVISWGETRDQAAYRLTLALEDLPFLGVKTNGEYIARILNNDHFLKGETYTHFVKTHAEELKPHQLTSIEKALMMAQVHWHKGHDTKGPSTEGSSRESEAWGQLKGFRNS